MTERAPFDNPSDELWRWPAFRMAEAIKRGEVSSREAVLSCLERIAAVNPSLNALVEVSNDEAMHAARIADDMLANGQALGPLHGVPMALKVNIDQAGHATTDGLPVLADNVASEDSPQARNLRRAGAIFVGRSNTPAFSYRWFTDNDLHGQTLNPWNRAHTPGGSSGGAGAAVASGMVPLAHGNDIGGSIRYPAYACGIAGLRPTVGRAARALVRPTQDATLSMQMISVDGPLARSVHDLRMTLHAMSKPHARDPFHVPGDPSQPALPGPLRIGLVRDVGVAMPTPAVNQALDNTAAALEAVGYEVVEVELPLLADAYRLWYLLCLEEFRLMMPTVRQIGDKAMQTAAEGYYQVAADWWGDAPTLAQYINGYARRGTLIAQLQAFMEDYPLILLPISSEQAFEQDADLGGVDTVRHLMAAQWPMMAIALLGFPALSVPTGVANGLPVGIQLLGRRFDESLLLDIGAVIESRVDPLTPIDPR